MVPVLHMLLYVGQIFDWLVKDTRVVIGFDGVFENLAHNELVKLVENNIILDLIQSIIGSRQKRGDEFMPMNGRQCSTFLNFSKSVLDCLNRYSGFAEAKQVFCFYFTWFSRRLFCFFIDISGFMCI